MKVTEIEKLIEQIWLKMAIGTYSYCVDELELSEEIAEQIQDHIMDQAGRSLEKLWIAKNLKRIETTLEKVETKLRDVSWKLSDLKL